MKKIAAILLTVLTVISLTACGGEKEPTGGSTSDTGNTTENISGEVESKGNDSAESTMPEVASEPESNKSTSGPEETKILVAYFSATNTTEGVAETIADSLSADIYEIVPEQPYTDDDLNYHDDNSRSTIEMNDSSARPAISGSVENMEQYNIVFIGYAGGIIGLN